MTMGDGGSVAPPGWYPDGDGWERRWDGTQWTADRRPVQPGPSGGSPWAPPGAGSPPGPGGTPAGPPAGAPGQPGYGGSPYGAPSPSHPSSAPTAFGAPLPQQGPPAGPPGYPQGPPQGPPPGGYGGPGGPGGPSYGGPPTPPRKKKSLLWLWVVLAVVLIVLIGVAVTLFVTKPWDDDDSSGGRDGNTSSTEDTGGTTEGGGGDPGVTGDIDGDGLGDAVGRYYDDSEHRLTLTNTDGKFEPAQEPVPEEEQLFVADFNGDETSEVASWFDASGSLRFQVEGADMQDVTVDDLELWFQVEALKATVGDIDGDGLTDVLVYGQTRRSQVGVWMLRNNGEGFDDPAKWASLQNATYGSTTLVVGDWDGDGTDDVLAQVPNQPLQKGSFNDTYWYGDWGLSLLTSTGSEFEVGPVTATEFDFSDDAYAVGDFDGDGSDTIVTDDYGTLVLNSYDGSTLRPTGEQVTYELGEDGLLDGMTASDVDGDGLDDIVFTVVNIDDYSFSGAWVATAEEGEFNAPSQWASIPPCSGDYCEVTYFRAY